MRILHISDTHNQHRKLHNLPAADVIIHSGDMAFAGTKNEVLDFMNWFSGLNYKHKIFIAGNHDDCLDGESIEDIESLGKNCRYLCNSGLKIEGIKFWGVPLFLSDDIEGRYPKMIAKIPANTDILITHRPPFGILDKSGNINFGCPDLLERVLEIKPKYHLFGHIHNAYGIKKTQATTFANASAVNEYYQLSNQPFVFEI
jgi:Icc-related predicted phosphoesterase